MKKQKKISFGVEDYIKANKKLAREEELARNGGRWVAKDRPHKNLKKYDRKRDKKNFDSYLPLFFISLTHFLHSDEIPTWVTAYNRPRPLPCLP